MTHINRKYPNTKLQIIQEVARMFVHEGYTKSSISKIAKVLSMDYRALGDRLLEEFPEYVMKINEENLKNSMRKKKIR